MANDWEGVDYLNVHIPEGLPRSEYTCNQRRKELVQLALAAGSLKAIQSTKICSEYNVTHSMIAQDKTVIKRYIRARYSDADHVISSAIVAKQWALDKAIKGGDYNAVNRISTDMIEMMASLGAIDYRKDPSISMENKEYRIKFVNSLKDFKPREPNPMRDCDRK